MIENKLDNQMTLKKDSTKEELDSMSVEELAALVIEQANDEKRHSLHHTGSHPSMPKYDSSKNNIPVKHFSGRPVDKIIVNKNQLLELSLEGTSILITASFGSNFSDMPFEKDAERQILTLNLNIFQPYYLDGGGDTYLLFPEDNENVYLFPELQKKLGITNPEIIISDYDSDTYIIQQKN